MKEFFLQCFFHRFRKFRFQPIKRQMPNIYGHGIYPNYLIIGYQIFTDIGKNSLYAFFIHLGNCHSNLLLVIHICDVDVQDLLFDTMFIYRGQFLYFKVFRNVRYYFLP